MSGFESQAGGEHPSPGPLPKSRRWMLWIGLLAVLALAAYVVFRGHGARSAAAGRGRLLGPVTASVETAVKGDIGIYLNAIGTVTPVYTASITAQASGVLTAVNYTEGQVVHKGDALIDIDPRLYQAQLLAAEGALERDRNVLAQAQMDLERYRAAWARNGISKQLLDDQEKLVLQAQGTVKNDQGTVDYDQVQLSYCHITAPITGRIGLRLVDPGNVMQANGTTVLAVITQEQPITVVFTLAEDNLGQVQARMRKVGTLAVEAWDRAQGTRLSSGRLQSIDNQIDTTTGTVKLRALFANKDGALFPNQFVNTRLLVDTVSGATLVPSGAVQHNGPVAFVYVIANGTAAVRTVQPGVTDGGKTAVQGIDPGEVVATSSFEKLQAGSKVIESKPAPPDQPAAGGSP